MSCFTLILLVILGIFVMLSFIRWFEQITDAVDSGAWSKVGTLIVMPFMVWHYPSKFVAGRPTPVARHEPVRGFGSVPLKPKESPQPPESTVVQPPLASLAPPSDAPPPGTPKEFLGMPVIPPKKKSPRQAVDPEKLEKLRQKMREQGMLDD